LWLGHTSGRMVNEIPILLKEKRYAIAAASIIAYGGLLSIVLALTIASVVVPIFVNHDWQELACAMAVVYLTVFVLLAASYKSTFGINIDKMDEWARSAHKSFPTLFRTQHSYRERG
jgi:predicted ABC-type exoprotein transport system permease subunit